MGQIPRSTERISSYWIKRWGLKRKNVTRIQKVKKNLFHIWPVRSGSLLRLRWWRWRRRRRRRLDSTSSVDGQLMTDGDRSVEYFAFRQPRLGQETPPMFSNLLSTALRHLDTGHPSYCSPVTFQPRRKPKKLWKPTIGYSDADSAKLLSDEFSVHTMVIINVIYFAEKRNTNRTMKLSKHLAGQQRHMACNSCRHCKIKASIWRKLGDGNHVWRLSVSASRITSLKV